MYVSDAPLAVAPDLPSGTPAPDKRTLAFHFTGSGHEYFRKRIPDSAHFIMWDQPQQFQAEVKAFLLPR